MGVSENKTILEEYFASLPIRWWPYKYTNIQILFLKFQMSSDFSFNVPYMPISAWQNTDKKGSFNM